MSSDSCTIPVAVKVTGWVCGVLGILVVPWALLGLLLGAKLISAIEALSVENPTMPPASGGVTGPLIAWCAAECLIGLVFAVFGFAVAAGREWGRQGLLFYIYLAGVLGALGLVGSAWLALSAHTPFALFAMQPPLSICIALLALMYPALRWLSSPGVRAACAGPARLAPAPPPP